MKRAPSILAMAVLLAANAPLPAATFCVDSTSSMTNALALADSNNEDDTIRVVVGTINAPAGGFFFSPAAGDVNRSLDINGGWAAGCIAAAADINASKLSGGGTRNVLYVLRGAGSQGVVKIRRLHFLDAFSNAAIAFDNQGVALRILGNQHTGQTLVEHCTFTGNTTVDGLSTAQIVTPGQLTFRNNLVHGNLTGIGVSGVTLVPLGSAIVYVSGNTITANQALSFPGIGMGLTIEASATASVVLSNNIIWGNNTGNSPQDLFLSQPATLIGNNYGSLVMPPGGIVGGNLSVDPLFINASNNFRLSVPSPLRDIGVASPLGGQATSDLDGAARNQGTGVDLGAYEAQAMWNDELFKSGFE